MVLINTLIEHLMVDYTLHDISFWTYNFGLVIMGSGPDAEMNAKVEEIINILHLPYYKCFPYYNKEFNEYTQDIEITLRVQSEFNLKVQEITKNMELVREKLEKS